MRIGLALPHYDFSFPDGEPVSWERLLDAALRAERLGFDSIWISDHFFLDLSRYGGSDVPLGSVEAFTALAGLAARTERVRLGTLVAWTPFRNPGLLAKMATSIDLVSGGRFELGLGAGWYEREFEAFGYPAISTAERFARLEEVVQGVAALLRGGPVDLDGRFVHLTEAYNRPLPPREGGPPIWLGGKGGDRLLRLVARHAGGWNTAWRWGPEAFGERVGALRELWEAEGRDPATIRCSVGLYTLVGEDERDLVARFRALQRWTPGGALDGEMLDDYARDRLVGTPEAVVQQLAEFGRAGAEEVIVSAASLPFAVYDWSMLELLAEAIIPEAHAL